MPKDLSDSSLSPDSSEDEKPVAKKRKSEVKETEKPVSKKRPMKKEMKVVEPLDNVADSSGLEDGAYWLDNKHKKRVQVREFRGQPLIDIREMYEGPKGLAPGKKGISLTVDQWRGLCRLVDKVDEEIANRT